MRPCGCDIDVRVFGHEHCWTLRNIARTHITCQCAACGCTMCHKDR